MTGWITAVRDRLSVPAVAVELGLTLSGRAWTPCPGCGAARRSRSDRRGPVGVRSDGRGWRCHSCGAGGSALDLVALHLTGARDLAPVRQWLAERGWCDPSPDAPPVARRTPRPPPPPAPPPGRPPGLAAWWASLAPVDVDEEVAGYLSGRGIDPVIVAERDLARVVPPGSDRPRWAPRDPYRLVVPLYDASGVLASVRVRRCVEAPGPKSMAPRGYSTSGAVCACLLGRLVLASGLPAWWPEGQRLELAIVEGEIDHLALASAVGDADPCAAAVLGVAAGGWREDLAARIPDGSVVHVLTHADEAGDRYARQIRETLSDRCELHRRRAS